MRERPILFSGAMVRALLDGSKTQTRRAYKTRKHPDFGCEMAAFELAGSPQNVVDRMCPYGQPGDRLWVRETWRGVVEISPPGAPTEHGVARYVPDQQHCRRVEYAATQDKDDEPWRPSIHMPRWASRILLEIVSVRVERLQDISEADADAEGVEVERCCGRSSDACGTHLGGCCGQPETVGPVMAYRELWESINGAGSWDVNPWVWVVEFRRVMLPAAGRM